MFPASTDHGLFPHFIFERTSPYSAAALSTSLFFLCVFLDRVKLFSIHYLDVLFAISELRDAICVSDFAAILSCFLVHDVPALRTRADSEYRIILASERRLYRDHHSGLKSHLLHAAIADAERRFVSVGD
jgi:hypothetical protein